VLLATLVGSRYAYADMQQGERFFRLTEATPPGARHLSKQS
jgi:hypothetical protein